MSFHPRHVATASDRCLRVVLAFKALNAGRFFTFAARTAGCDGTRSTGHASNQLSRMPMRQLEMASMLVLGGCLDRAFDCRA